MAGYLIQTGLKAATGAPLSWKLNPDGSPRNPLAPFYPTSVSGVANFSALVGSLALSGVGDAAKEGSDTKTAGKVLGYGILGAIGALESLFTIDPPGDTTTPVGFVVQGTTPSTMYPVGETPPPTLSRIPAGITEPPSSFYRQPRKPGSIPTGNPAFFF